MHKNLKLHVALRMDPPDLIQAQLPRQYDPLSPHLMQKLHAIRAGDRHLRGCMERKVRECMLQKTKDTEVLHKHGIHAMLIDRCKVLRQLRYQLLFLQKRIHGQIEPDSSKMAIIDCLKQFLRVRIPGVCTCAEHPSARIDRIRSGIHRCPDPLHASARRKKLNPVPISRLHAHSLPF